MRFPLSALALFLVGCVSPEIHPAKRESKYFPVGLYNEWVYRVTDGAATWNESLRIAKCRIIENSLDCFWRRVAGDPKPSVKEGMWSLKPDGLYGTVHFTDKIGDVRSLNSYVELPILLYPLEIGREWSYGPWRVRVAGEEKVRVPAGTFQAFRLVRENTDLDEVVMESWYAPGVGRIKSLVYSYHFWEQSVVVGEELMAYRVK